MAGELAPDLVTRALGSGPPTEATTVLEVRGLSTEFVGPDGVTKAARGVSFRVARGQRVGIVGESGSGKSVTALSIQRLIDPPGRITEGEVWLNGRNLMEMREAELRRIRGKDIAMVFQDAMSAFNPVLTVGDQIAEAITLHRRRTSKREARTRAVQLLREVQIPAADRRVNSYPHEYSGGMLQRAMVAMVLSMQPSVIIADEPTTALDVTTQAQVIALLHEVTEKRGVAVVLITHDLGLVAGFCQVINVMYAGQIVERAMVDDIFRSPVHPYTEALLASVRRLDRKRTGRLAVVPGSPPSLRQLPSGCSFHPRCAYSKEVCISIEPDEVHLGAVNRQALARCHFASERFKSSGDTEVGRSAEMW